MWVESHVVSQLIFMLMFDKEKRKKIIKSLKDKQRRDSNPEYEKQRGRNYYKKNREKVLATQHEYYLSHKTQKKIYNKKYHEGRREK